VSLFAAAGLRTLTRKGLVVMGCFGWWRAPGMRWFSVPTASHEKGKRLGTMDGGEGWPVTTITKNGTAEPAMGKTSNLRSSGRLGGHGDHVKHRARVCTRWAAAWKTGINRVGCTGGSLERLQWRWPTLV
jgi:hypothetical protein